LALAHDADEPNSLAGGGADEALLLAAIVDGAPGGVDAARQRRVRYDTPVLHPGDQVVLADHAVAIANQKNNEVEDLRLDRDERAFTTQLAPVGIKNIVLEEEQQLAAPALALTVTARTLPHFATAKIKTSSRINQARLKDPRLRGGQSSRSENRTSIRAAISAQAPQTEAIRVRCLTRENE